jgi:dinuclear metal center YbgI/SA1388 family protein
MIVSDITHFLESIAPLSLQESYDNAGLQTGHPLQEVSGVLVTLDVTEAVVEEAIQAGCNMIVAHHPVIFGGIKRLTGRSYTERVIIKAVKHDIAIYAIHTNLDNVLDGVNATIAEKLGLIRGSVLQPKPGQLKKMVTFAPEAHAGDVRFALFQAGAGAIGNYDHCSFNASGTGTFRGNASSDPFVGKKGEDHEEAEVRIEVIYPQWAETSVLKALLKAHPYEEVAYDLYNLSNSNKSIGSGWIGMLPEEMDEVDFLRMVATKMEAKGLRHTALLGRKVRKVAVCGGSGSFLIKDAIMAGADVFLTADIKYHQFFDADGRILLVDIGHFESEQYTRNLLESAIREKFANFAVRLSKVNTNPINYL